MLFLIKYRLKCTLGDRLNMFWALFFPLILATLFYFTIGSIGKADFETIPVAVVEEGQGVAQETFVDFLKEVEKDENNIISVEVMEDSMAKEKLAGKEIKGIFYAKEVPTLTVKSKGIETSILETLLENYIDNSQMITNIATMHPERLEQAIASMNDYKELVESVAINGKTINGNIQYFFALIAMGCMYGSFLGFSTVLGLQANLTPLAARRCITPIHRLKLVIVDMIGTSLIHCFNMTVLLFYLKYVLRLEFNGKMGAMLLVTVVGSILGVSMGILVGSIGKMAEGLKIGILLGVSMFSSFLSGLMFAEIKDIIERHIPIINRINPATVITDAFYCLNVYENSVRFTKDIISLLIMSGLMIMGAFLAVRREQYDSI